MSNASDIKNARSNIIGEPSRLSQNVQHCKYEDLFWNSKMKNSKTSIILRNKPKTIILMEFLYKDETVIKYMKC